MEKVNVEAKERLVRVAQILVSPEYLRKAFDVEDINALTVEQLAQAVIESAQQFKPAVQEQSEEDVLEELKELGRKYWDEKIAKEKKYKAEKESIIALRDLVAYFDKRAQDFEGASELPRDLATFRAFVPEQQLVFDSQPVPILKHGTRRVIILEGDRFGIDAGHVAIADDIPSLPVFYKVGYGAGDGARRALDQVVAIRTSSRTIILMSEGSCQMAKPLRKKFAGHFDRDLPGLDGQVEEIHIEEPASSKRKANEEAGVLQQSLF